MTAAARLSAEALADIQGFVTSGYGHLPHAAYLFLRVTDAAGARRWLADLRPAIATAARDRRDPAPAVNVMFTAPGLRACGVADAVLCTFPPEFQQGIATPRRSRILGDSGGSAPSTWEVGGEAEPVHAIVIVHAATAGGRADAVAAERGRFAAAGAGREAGPGGQAGVRPDGDYEPFGFHDGIAQPRLAAFGGDVPTGEFILGYGNHYGLVAPGPVVPAALDPAGLLPPFDNPHHASGAWRDLGRHGTFVVYRKLAQDVAGFWQWMRDEAARLGGGTADAAAMVRLAASCMGRWPSGAPLALAPDRDAPPLHDRDDFLYAGDPDGRRCPLGAHVRRANPRDDLKPYPAAQSRSMTEAHRLLRRARVFGDPLFAPELLQRPSDPAAARTLLSLADDGRARGIHFFAVNASIASQFEFVQQSWCNNPHFGGLVDNQDPIVGEHGVEGGRASRMTIPGEPTVRTSPLRRFVHVRAGAYTFMPGLRALRFLAG